ncbi:hypothetical protein D3C80_2028570 [compost metagenome]
MYLAIAGMCGSALIAAGALRGRRELELIIIEAARELKQEDRVSPFTAAEIMSAARSISE